MKRFLRLALVATIAAGAVVACSRQDSSGETVLPAIPMMPPLPGEKDRPVNKIGS